MEKNKHGFKDLQENIVFHRTSEVPEDREREDRMKKIFEELMGKNSNLVKDINLHKILQDSISSSNPYMQRKPHRIMS